MFVCNNNRIKSISASDNSPARPTHLASAESAFSRISSALQKSASAVRSGASSAIASAASSASAVSSSAASAQSSAASASASVSASASASATAGASSGAAITVVDNTLFVQCSALAALFIASFIAILA